MGGFVGVNVAVGTSVVLTGASVVGGDKVCDGVTVGCLGTLVVGVGVRGGIANVEMGSVG